MNIKLPLLIIFSVLCVSEKSAHAMFTRVAKPTNARRLVRHNPARTYSKKNTFATNTNPDSFFCQESQCHQRHISFTDIRFSPCFWCYEDEDGNFYPCAQMLKRGENFLKQKDEINLILWLKNLKLAGIDPNIYFLPSDNKDSLSFATTLLMRACYGNMPDVIEYLLLTHDPEKFNCLLFTPCTHQSTTVTLIEWALNVVETNGFEECAKVLAKYIEENKLTFK